VQRYLSVDSKFSRRLRSLRALKGWKQETLATEAEVSLRTIKRMENIKEGEKRRFLPSRLYSVARALGIPLNELVDESSLDHADAKEIVVGPMPGAVAHHFKDRTDELQTLRRKLEDEEIRLILITGRGGIGKTSLLVKLLRGLEGEFKEGRTHGSIIYIPLDQREYRSLTKIIELICRTVEPKTAEELLERWSRGYSLEERLEFLFHHILNKGRYIIALDSLEDLLDEGNHISDEFPDLRAFLERCLEYDHRAKVIATSRHALIFSTPLEGHIGERMEEIKLEEGLPEDEAIALLRELDHDGKLGIREAPDDILRQVVSRCYGIPRTLERIVGTLRQRRTLTISRLLEDEAAFDRLIENPARELHESLSRDERLVMQTIAVYGRAVPASAVRHVLPDLPVDDLLDSLVRNYAVSFSSGLFSLHPLDRSYIYQRIPDMGERYTKSALHRLAGRFYVNLAQAIKGDRSMDSISLWERAVKFRWMEVAGRAIEHISAAKAWEDLIDIHELVRAFYLLEMDLGNSDECKRICQLMLDASKSASITSEEVEWLHNWAVLNHNLGNYEHARQICLQGLKIAHRSDRKILQASLLQRLGMLARDNGDHKEARRWYRKSEEVLSQTYIIGVRYAELLEKEGYLDKALEIQKEVLSSFPQRLISTGYRIARILRKQGRYADAKRLCDRSLTVARDLGRKRYLSKILLELGRIMAAFERYDKAHELLSESIKISVYPRDRVRVLHAIGDLNHLLGRLDEAIRYYKDALFLNFPFMSYSCAVKLGAVCLERGEVEKARYYLEQGVRLCHMLLSKTPRLYDVIYHLALAQLCLGKFDESLAAYKRAMEICDAKGVIEEEVRDLHLLKGAMKGNEVERAIEMLSFNPST